MGVNKKLEKQEGKGKQKNDDHAFSKQLSKTNPGITMLKLKSETMCRKKKSVNNVLERGGERSTEKGPGLKKKTDLRCPYHS